MRLFAKPLRLFRTTAVAAPKKVAAPFYQSPEWRALLRQIFRERGRRCQDCGSVSGRMYGDHIVEISDGGAKLDPENIRIRCAPCHGKKTAAARAARFHGTR